MSPDLRDLLREVAPVAKSPFALGAASRRGRLQALRRPGGATLLVCAFVAGVFVVLPDLARLGEDRRTQPAGAEGVADSGARGCRERPAVDEQRGAYGTIITEATTPVVRIASEEQKGQRWSLCAYRATVTRNENDAWEALCSEFQIGPGPQSGYACYNTSDTVPADADYFLRTAGGMEKREVTAYFIGAISDRVARVTITPREGSESAARIYEPPEELGVQYSFFVGFAPSGTDVTVSVEDASGVELEHETFGSL